MRRRYGVLVSAAILALQLAGDVAAQETTVELDQLETISAFLDANDVEGLRSYLAVHPELLEGDGDLARLLREFMEQSADMAAFLGGWQEAAGFADSDDDPAPASEGGEEPVAGAVEPEVSLY